MSTPELDRLRIEEAKVLREIERLNSGSRVLPTSEVPTEGLHEDSFTFITPEGEKGISSEDLSESLKSSVQQALKNTEQIRIQKLKLSRIKSDIEFESRKDDNTPWTLKYPSDLGEVEYKQNFMRFTFYEHKPDVKRTKDYKKEHIVYPIVELPISPRMMYSAIDLNYLDTELNQLGSIIYENAREHGATTQGIGQAIAHAFSEGEIKDVAESFFLSHLLTTKLAGVAAANHGYGIAFNENRVALFNDYPPRYRSFQPTWTFVPKNETDALKLDDIVKVFQRNLLPRTVNPISKQNLLKDGRTITSRYSNHFKYPRKVKVDFFIGRQKYDKISFLPMIITSSDVSNNDKSGSLGVETVPLHKINENFYHTETTLNVILEETEVYTRRAVDEVHAGLGRNKETLKVEKVPIPVDTNGLTPVLDVKSDTANLEADRATEIFNTSRQDRRRDSTRAR